MAGEKAPNSGVAEAGSQQIEDPTKKAEAEILALRKLIEQKDKVIAGEKAPANEEDRTKVAEALTARNAAEARIAVLEKRKIEQKAGVSAKAAEATTKVAESAEAALTAPATAPTEAGATNVDASKTTPAVEAPAVAPAVVPTAVAAAKKEKPDVFANILKSGKVMEWLSKHPGLKQIAELIGPLFGLEIDWGAHEAKSLAKGSQAKLNETELSALQALTSTPELKEVAELKIDEKDQNAPWKHIANLLGTPKITSMPDFYSIAGAKRQVNLGADKGGTKEVPDFMTSNEAPNGGYKAGDVLIYTNKDGDRIPAVVKDASEPNSPIISFVNIKGILPVGQKFDEIKDLQYAITGTFDNASVKKGLEGFELNNVYRAATLADQQEWYAAKNPKPVAAPTPETKTS